MDSGAGAVEVLPLVVVDRDGGRASAAATLAQDLVCGRALSAVAVILCWLVCVVRMSLISLCTSSIDDLSASSAGRAVWSQAFSRSLIS